MTVVPAGAADAPKAQDLTARIIDAGMNHGEIMLTAQYLADRIGGRIPNSPAMRAAERWTQGRYRDWGLTNGHAEPFLFRRGWSIEAINVRMTVPRVLTLRAIPVAFTPGTAGTVTADIIFAPVDTYDLLKATDLRQDAVIMAIFSWNAANRAEQLPRLVLTKSAETNPFAYPEPEN